MDAAWLMVYRIVSVMVVLLLIWPLFVAFWRSKRLGHIPSLQGKHVVITGGSSGIGLALAKLCLYQGASLTLIARNPSRLSRVSSDLLSSYPASCPPQDRILLKAADVSDPTALASAMAESIEWRPIDILICNAGTSLHGTFDGLKAKDLDHVTRTNILGCVFAIHAALEHMKERSMEHPCSIVLMSSLSCLLFLPGGNIYAPTKYALKGLAEMLRFELMPHNIKVSLVCPGFTETPLLDEADKASSDIGYILRKLTFYDRGNAESAEDVAAKTIEGVKRGNYLITTSAIGFLLGVLGRGFAPAESFSHALIELLLLVPVRLSSFVWFAYARRIMRGQGLQHSHSS